MTRKIPLDEIADFLKAVNRGWITVAPVVPITVVYPQWIASNGWKICVFDDAGSWDYIEWVESSDGRRSEYKDIYPDGVYDNPVEDAEPNGDEVERIWNWSDAT